MDPRYPQRKKYSGKGLFKDDYKTTIGLKYTSMHEMAYETNYRV